MNEQNNKVQNNIDPSVNVREMINEAVERLDDLRKSEVSRMNEKFISFDDKMEERDIKYQIQFTAAEKAVGIASTAQKELVAQALAGTKEAITKNDTNTDKRFELLSEKIDAVSDILSKNSGAQGIYVTHSDLSNEMSKLRTDFEIMLRPVVTFMNNSQGKSSGLNAGWGYLIGGVGLASTIILLIMRL